MPTVQRSKPSMHTHVTALKTDVNASILNLSKGSGVKAATLNDLKKWLDAAVKSPTDGVKALREGWEGGTGRGSTVSSPLEMPVLKGKALKSVLNTVNQRLIREQAATNPVKGGEVKRPTQKELKAWVTQALLEAAQNEVKVKLKSGGTRPATTAELTRWIEKAN